MATTYAYTGDLQRITNAPLPASVFPEARIRPRSAAFSRDGLVSADPVTLDVAPDGTFTVNLIPSGALRDSLTHRPGVNYVVELARFELDLAGQQMLTAVDVYEFTAAAGGGDIGDMPGASLLAVWVGPPWPALPSPAGLYIDKVAPNPWGVKY